jgi:BrxA
MSEPLFTSRLIKASALIGDTKTLLAHWDLTQDIPANLERARSENIFGKASRSRVEDVLRIFRQRYFDDPEIGEALVTLVQGGAPAQWIDPLLYYYTVRNDETLRAIVLEIVYRRQMGGYADISIEMVMRNLRDWVAGGRTTSDWGEETIYRVAKNALTALRDFGILSGKATKSITPIYLPVEAFALLAFEMQRRTTSGDQILHSEDWKLFFLPVEGVERFFLEAHQERLLAYYAAGSVVRLEFPAQTLVEYAHVLVERARA